MRDTEARSLVNSLQVQVGELNKKLAVLTERYDALFDFLASELGFEAAEVTVWFPQRATLTDSPRHLGMTSCKPEVKRTKNEKKP